MEIDERGERVGRRVMRERSARWEESDERGERGGRRVMREENEVGGE